MAGIERKADIRLAQLLAMLSADSNLAERVGFEPTKGYKPLLVFKTSAFDHSATSPVRGFAPRIVLAPAPGFNSESNPIAIDESE